MKYKAKVLSFNKSSGEGLVKLVDFSGVYDIYACNIPGKRTWYANTACMYYDEGQTIEVEATDEGLLKCLTPGIFDKEKWDSLDHSRLAFKCDENGDAVNGLLPPGTFHE